MQNVGISTAGTMSSIATYLQPIFKALIMCLQVLRVPIIVLHVQFFTNILHDNA